MTRYKTSSSNIHRGLNVDKPFYDKPITVYGHDLDLSGESVGCKRCDCSRDVPDLVQMSSGFREALYKVYMISFLKHETCEPLPEKMDDHTDVSPLTQKKTIHRVDPDRMHWSGTGTNTTSLSRGELQKLTEELDKEDIEKLRKG